MSTLRCTKCAINEPWLSPQAHLPLPTPPSLSPIPQARHCNAAAFVVVPELIITSSHKLNTTYLLGCWLRILFGDGFRLWLLVALVYLTFFGIDTVEKSWCVNWIPREFTRSIKSFGSSSICVVCNIDKTGKKYLKLATELKTTYLWVVDLVLRLVMVSTCDCWAR